MLHAVKYLLIAMQFPQVHKSSFMMMMSNSAVSERGKTWIELSNSKDLLTVSFFVKANCTLPSARRWLLTLKIYNLQLNSEPFATLFRVGSGSSFKMIQFRVFFSWRESPGSARRTFKNTLRLVTYRMRLQLWKVTGGILWIINQINVLWALSPPTVKIAEDEWKFLMNECKLIQLQALGCVLKGDDDSVNRLHILTSWLLAFSIGTRAIFRKFD